MKPIAGSSKDLEQRRERVLAIRRQANCGHVTRTCNSFFMGRCGCLCAVCQEVRRLKSSQLWQDTGFASG
jgi:hypothetical protein